MHAVHYLLRSGDLHSLNRKVSLALQHRADAVHLKVYVVIPGHLDALLQQLVHSDLHARHGHTGWLRHDLDLADAALSGAILDPQEDQ